jgi:outer membrane protein assembly factor BamB
MPDSPQPELRTNTGVLSRAWRLTAWVAAVFTTLVGLGMLVSHFRAKPDDPLKSPQLQQYKDQLKLNPADEALKQRIRQLDLQLRQRHFRHLSQTRLGACFMSGGAVLLVLAASQVARLEKRRPRPCPRAQAATDSARADTLAPWSVAATGAALGALLFLLSLTASSVVPTTLPDVDAALGAAPSPAAGAQQAAAPLPAGPADAASPEEMRQNWPRFRGPDGGGVAASTNAPTSWDLKTGSGVAWKIRAPSADFGSLIVWGDHVFFSGGNAAKREVFCLDARTGAGRWRQAVENVPLSPAHPDVPETTGYAAATMATDGRRLYAVFANGDVAALTFDGKVVWSKSFGPLQNPYGHAASPVTWKDQLILQLDQGEAEERKSKLLALDGRNGKLLWEKQRKVSASWATPIVIEAAGKAQIITLAVPAVIAYSAADGAELWRVDGLDGEITPSPAFAGGLVLAICPSQKLMAIHPEGQGNVTKTHVAWSAEDNIPDITSPVSNGELVFTISSAGMATCYDAKDGKKVWEHDFDMECHSSPSLAGNRLYLFSEKGAAIMVEAGRQFKELFRTEMNDAFHASPAFAQDRIFLRGVTNIYCLDATKH